MVIIKYKIQSYVYKSIKNTTNHKHILYIQLYYVMYIYVFIY